LKFIDDLTLASAINLKEKLKENPATDPGFSFVVWFGYFFPYVHCNILNGKPCKVNQYQE